MKELDVLLERFLKQRYSELNPRQKDSFEQFLSLQDPELVAYLLKGVSADNKETRDVVQQILSCDCA